MLAGSGTAPMKVTADGEIDVAILTKPRVDKLVREAKIVGGSTKTLASAQIGLAVKKGATKPDISSVDARDSNSRTNPSGSGPRIERRPCASTQNYPFS